MKSLFVTDITRETRVHDYFLVSRKGIYTSKNSTKYVSLKLRDRTGVIDARIWDRVEELGGAFEPNDVVYVESRAKSYQDVIQLTVTDIRKVDRDLTFEEIREFYPENESGSPAAWERFGALCEAIENPHLRLLFAELERREDIMSRFRLFPASVGVHHVSVGGLLEHSVSVAEMGRRIAPQTGGHGDIIVAGALLHDLGKVRELTLRGGFGYSDEGRLLGHITLGIVMLEELTRKIDAFPPCLADILKHIILSHHGEAEWGSPKKPMCVEAMTVHYLDNLDARISGVKEHMREGMEDERWTRYHKLYESRFYLIPEGDLWK